MPVKLKYFYKKFYQLKYTTTLFKFYSVYFKSFNLFIIQFLLVVLNHYTFMFVDFRLHVITPLTYCRVQLLNWLFFGFVYQFLFLTFKFGANFVYLIYYFQLTCLVNNQNPIKLKNWMNIMNKKFVLVYSY